MLLLENTRLHVGEASSDAGFAQELAALADVYVNDAFGVCHRDQASVTGITRHVRHSFPGPLVRLELTHLGELPRALPVAHWLRWPAAH